MDAMQPMPSASYCAPLQCSARVRRAGDFLLLAQEKVTKDAPQSIAPFVRPARTVRASGRVPLTAHPCPDNGIGVIHRAAPAGVSARSRRNAMGTRKSRSSALLRAEAKSPARRALDSALDLRVPVCRGEGRTEMLAESRARCARVRCLYTDVQSTNPGLTSRTAAGGAVSGECSLWLLSLAQARESNPRAGRARKNEGTRVRRDKSWIPAFAEMTIQEKSAAADGQ
jgi:hypothetical protein